MTKNEEAPTLLTAAMADEAIGYILSDIWDHSGDENSHHHKPMLDALRALTSGATKVIPVGGAPALTLAHIEAICRARWNDTWDDIAKRDGAWDALEDAWKKGTPLYASPQSSTAEVESNEEEHYHAPETGPTERGEKSEREI